MRGRYVHIEPLTRSPRMNVGNARWLAAAALFLVGCGPSDQEIGVATVSSLVLVVPLAAAINFGLHRLWRGSRELLEPSWSEAALAWLAITTIATALNVFVARIDDGDLVWIALWVIGTTYLTYFSLGIGVALALRRPWAFRGVYLMPAALVAALALPLALDVDLGSDVMAAIFTVLMWSGGLGFAGGGLFLLLLGVSIWVFVRDRRRPRDAAPPLSF